MDFTISGEDFTFTLQVDGAGQLTSFTATRGSSIVGNTTYDCSIQLKSQTNPPEVLCCTPSGCTSGPC